MSVPSYLRSDSGHIPESRRCHLSWRWVCSAARPGADEGRAYARQPAERAETAGADGAGRTGTAVPGLGVRAGGGRVGDAAQVAQHQRRRRLVGDDAGRQRGTAVGLRIRSGPVHRLTVQRSVHLAGADLHGGQRVLQPPGIRQRRLGRGCGLLAGLAGRVRVPGDQAGRPVAESVGRAGQPAAILLVRGRAVLAGGRVGADRSARVRRRIRAPRDRRLVEQRRAAGARHSWRRVAAPGRHFV